MTSSMEPKTTPSAYRDIKFPAAGIDTPIDLAVSGRIPIITYSLIPNPKVPRARGKRHIVFRIIILRYLFKLYSKQKQTVYFYSNNHLKLFLLEKCKQMLQKKHFVKFDILEKLYIHERNL